MISIATRRAIASVGMIVVLAAIYTATFNLRSVSDTTLNSRQTKALVLHGDVDVARYHPGPTEYAFRHGRGTYSIYGVGISVVSAPVYAILARVGASDAVEQGAAVIPFAALAVFAMWLLLRRFAKPALAAGGALTFAFGTTLWPLASMALYQHASVALFHVLGFAAFLSNRRNSSLFAGLALGAAAFVRLPAALPLVCVGLFYLAFDRPRVIRLIGGSLAGIAGIVIQNRWIWGKWLTGGYSLAGIGFHGHVGHAVWGLLFGWFRGLFAYSPVLLLAGMGLFIALRDRSRFAWQLVAIGISAITTVGLYSRWSTWDGGLNQFGYRYLLDIVPALIILGVYGVQKVPRLIPLALGLAVISGMTMTFGAAPNRFAWDGNFLATRFVDASIGQAWIAALDRPLQTLIRIVGVCGVCGVFWRLSLVPSTIVAEA